MSFERARTRPRVSGASNAFYARLVNSGHFLSQSGLGVHRQRRSALYLSCAHSFAILLSLIGFVCSYYSYRSITQRRRLLRLLLSFCAKKSVSEWSMEGGRAGEERPPRDNGARRLATAFKAALARSLLGLSIPLCDPRQTNMLAGLVSGTWRCFGESVTTADVWMEHGRTNREFSKCHFCGSSAGARGAGGRTESVCLLPRSCQE